MNQRVWRNVGWMVVAGLFALLAVGRPAGAGESGGLNVLFVGNSYTARHNLSQVVKAMAEARNPGLRMDVTTVIYGGRRLVDHWRLGSQNFVNITTVTAEQVQATIKGLEETLAKDPKDRFAQAAIGRQKDLLRSLSQPRRKWDIVVLQSYRDDLDGEKSLYVEFAPRFAELIKAQGGRVVLYETTPTTQNARPLTAAPDPKAVIEKEKVIAALGKRLDATVVPMAMVGLQCQTTRPDLTLRFVNDAHLNHTMAYLTACTFYGAIFNRSPEGLAVDSVTDTKSRDGKHRDQDMDGQPIKRVFSEKDRAELQRMSWEGLKKFREIGGER